MKRALARANGRRATKTLAAILADYENDAILTRSELERRFLDICRRAGVTPPVVNGDPEGVEVDFHWPHLRPIVEVDGRDTHATREAFENDRRRDQRHAVAGWRTVRVTYRQVERTPDGVEDTLRALSSSGSRAP